MDVVFSENAVLPARYRSTTAPPATMFVRVLVAVLLSLLIGVANPVLADASGPDGGAADMKASATVLVPLYRESPPGEIRIEKLPMLDARQAGFREISETPLLRRGSEHWFHYTLPPMDSGGHRRYVEVRFPNIDVATAFTLYSDGALDRAVFGDDIAHVRWPLSTRLPTLRLDENADRQAQAVYLMLEPTGQPAVLPVVLLSEPRFLARQQLDYLWYGAFFGACLVLVLYNLFLYVSTRAGSYLLYVLYLSVFTVLQASTSGIGQQYLWPHLEMFTTRFALVLIGLTNAAVLWFVIGFLQLRRRHPRLVLVLVIASAIALMLPILLVLPDYIVAQNAQHAYSIVCMLLIYGIAIRCVREGSRPAAYLLVSYTILFAGILLALLRYNGLVGTTFATEHLMEVAILLEAVILSLGLADRINDLQNRNRLAAIDARERQARYTRELIRAHEREKRHFGSILHDHVGHSLVGFQYHLQQLRDRLGSSSDAVEHDINALETDAGALHEDIRQIAREAHPYLLSQLGLSDAIDRLLARALDGSDVQGSVACSDVRFDDDTELHLYRIVQECISNTLRHAGASEILIRLETTPDGFELYYRDDGVGLSDGQIDAAEGFGLFSIRQRCLMMDAELAVCEEPVAGFCLRVTGTARPRETV